MSLDMTSKVRNKRKTTRKRDGKVRITSQGQVSIPRQAMREAGLKPGDTLQANVDEHGNIVLSPVQDLVARFAGSVKGGMTQEDLQRMRDEWDR